MDENTINDVEDLFVDKLNLPEPDELREATDPETIELDQYR